MKDFAGSKDMTFYIYMFIFVDMSDLKNIDFTSLLNNRD